MRDKEEIPQFKTLEEERAYWESKGPFGIEAQREGIKLLLQDLASGKITIDDALIILQEAGVVIGVECPTCHGIGVFGTGGSVKINCGMCNGAGYAAVESLIDAPQ